MKPIQSIPNANRTFTALRSLGYNLNSSVADLIDNSISAKAKKINIVLSRKNDSFYLFVQDDGKGMTENRLEEAMRIGSETVYEETDLGKYGLGMKTASLSHCNDLTVISKTKTSCLSGFQWNMEHIQEANQWELLKLSNKEVEFIFKERVGINYKGSDTIVIWENMSDLDRNYESYSIKKFAENYLFRVVDELRLYIANVFHRFLDGSLGGKNHIEIKINKKIVKGWDPFCSKEEKTIKINLKEEASKFLIKGYNKPVRINAYVLPNQQMFSSEKAWKEAKGILSWNDAQGYYIYREGRLIKFGGWQGTKFKDEHDKLARISIDVKSEMDEIFRINVNKNKIQFPELLFNHLKNIINPLVSKKAKDQYKKSDSKISFANRFRKQNEKLNNISKNFVKKEKIKTSYIGNNGDDKSILINNKAGQFISNKISEFYSFGNNAKFEVVSGELDNDLLWKLVSDIEEKFKVVVNSRHPFYQKIYEGNHNKSLTSVIDALFMSLALSELYNKNEQNTLLFETYKLVCAQVLENLIKEE